MRNVKTRVTERRRRAARVARLFRDWYQLNPRDPKGDQEAAVRDVLADVRHYCDAHSIDFARQSNASYVLYLDEREAVPAPGTPRLAVCACGHTGNTARSRHAERFSPGHGECMAKDCKCKQFTWVGWAK